MADTDAQVNATAFTVSKPTKPSAWHDKKPFLFCISHGQQRHRRPPVDAYKPASGHLLFLSCGQFKLHAVCIRVMEG